jgi:hypothetical protein
MNWKKKLLIGFGIVLIAAGIYAYKEYNRKNKDLTSASADFKMSSDDLISSFEKNEEVANKKYLDKVIQLDGNVKEVIKDDKGYYTIVFGNHGMSSVRCSMDTAHQQLVASVMAGKPISVKGICTGFNSDELLGSDVILNRCVISK